MNREAERKRLVELVSKRRRICKNANCGLCGYAVFGGYPQCQDKKLADILFEDGWTRQPVELGDVVYFVERNSGKPIGTIDEIKIVMIGRTETGFCAKGQLGENTVDIIPPFEIDNYTFFSSREEAKKALKGAEGK